MSEEQEVSAHANYGEAVTRFLAVPHGDISVPHDSTLLRKQARKDSKITNTQEEMIMFFPGTRNARSEKNLCRAFHVSAGNGSGAVLKRRCGEQDVLSSD